MRLQVPRIPALAPEDWSDEAKQALAAIGRPGGMPALNIFRTLAAHPKLTKHWMVFANHVLGKNTLPPREREILILRIGWLCRAEYEWAQHVVIGKREGLSDDEIARIGIGADAPGWSEPDRALLRATDELWNDAMISDGTWRDLVALPEHRTTDGRRIHRGSVQPGVDGAQQLRRAARPGTAAISRRSRWMRATGALALATLAGLCVRLQLLPAGALSQLQARAGLPGRGRSRHRPLRGRRQGVHREPVSRAARGG